MRKAGRALLQEEATQKLEEQCEKEKAREERGLEWRVTYISLGHNLSVEI